MANQVIACRHCDEVFLLTDVVESNDLLNWVVSHVSCRKLYVETLPAKKKEHKKSATLQAEEAAAQAVTDANEEETHG